MVEAKVGSRKTQYSVTELGRHKRSVEVCSKLAFQAEAARRNSCSDWAAMVHGVQRYYPTFFLLLILMRSVDEVLQVVEKLSCELHAVFGYHALQFSSTCVLQ